MKFYSRKSRALYAKIGLVILINQMFVPSVIALTAGPSQPEVKDFEPMGTTEMVDLFSGDFTYNIPLFELPGPHGGYPFNLAYHAGIGVEDEASWVGLGWSLNPGAITRQVRGLPDEFKGDLVETITSMKPDVTVGVKGGANIEFFGADNSVSTIGISPYFNSYTGVGYSIDGNLAFGKAIDGMRTGPQLDLGFSLNPDEGVGLEPSFGLAGNNGEFGLSTGYHSKAGLQYAQGSGNLRMDNLMTKKDSEAKVTGAKSLPLRSSASLTFSHPGSFPQISMPMRHFSFNATVKFGVQFFGAFVNSFLGGFYNESRLQDNGKPILTPAFGYLNSEAVGDGSFVMDVNREKEGIVNKETPNLAIPHLSYDIYSVSGQGISAMYRPFRNDVGIIRDPEIKSGSVSLGAGGELPVKHWGVNLSGNTVNSTSGKWTSGNDLDGVLGFKQWESNNLYEPWYFKSHGEQSVQTLRDFSKTGNEDALRVNLSGVASQVKASTTLVGAKGPVSAHDIATMSSERKPRNQTIIPFTNEDILKEGDELLNIFKIGHFDYFGINSTDREVYPYDRTRNPKHHFAGFTAISPDGLRYNYGLPAYNRVHEEYQFSVPADPGSPIAPGSEEGERPQHPEHRYPNTDQYLKATKIPEYPHAYLLTSIVGSDYVDVTGDGVTEDDLGYWVKFTYLEQTSYRLYKWRDPVFGAYRHEGGITNYEDDRGTFFYGEKELWFLAQVETKSHLAKFSLEERRDAGGVDNRLTESPDGSNDTPLRLNSITLYSKGSAGLLEGIKKVKFQYDYSLCQNAPNAESGGKLTLRKVWFEFGHQIAGDGEVSIGSLSPYEFTYDENRNFDYEANSMDRWGTYKPVEPSSPRANIDYPYVDQNPENRALVDSYAGAWSLTGIRLPSGGEILVDYESDDYGYVQHKQAMQMTQFVNPTGASNGSLSPIFNLDKNNLKIRFPLKRKIQGTLNSAGQESEVKKYLDIERGQIYFKLLVNLRSPGEAFFDVVEGYAEIDDGKPMILEKDGSGDYVYGSFFVKAEKGFHPFSLRAWQHVRVNRPDLTAIHGKIPSDRLNSIEDKIKYMRGMSSLVPHVIQMLKGFYSYCNDRSWGQQVDSGASYIRLSTPDKRKVGGGLRVRQITMRDNWSDQEEGIYGHVYEYTTDEKGELISSGVASNEPFVGAEENSLRHAKKYSQSIPLRSNNSLYFEYPINESVYPGARIGYSKVTVMTLASAFKAGKSVKNITLGDNGPLFPVGPEAKYGTSGVTVHEFYTARDFPVRTYETDKKDIQHQVGSLVSFLGVVEKIHLTSSQGYSVVTNDMHGKQKMVATYRQQSDGTIQSSPISWVRYNYFSEEAVYDNSRIFKVNNTFQMGSDGLLEKMSGESNVHDHFAIGQELDLFVDMRESKDNIQGTGVNLNVDFVTFAAIPTAWPNLTRKENLLRTVVTNKVVFQAGILESIEAFDEGSLVTTRFHKWDSTTGSPLVSVVTNNFDAPIYSYSIPAHHHYKSMDGAYRNIGLNFYLSDVRGNPKLPNTYTFNTESGISQHLTPGDEIIVYDSNSSEKLPLAKVTFLGSVENQLVIYSKEEIETGTGENPLAYFGKIVRSGYRNQLSPEAGKIVALQDPSIGTVEFSVPSQVKLPKGHRLNDGGTVF